MQGRLIGTYTDREAITAPGASWFVRISPTMEVDMEATAGHIFLNATYCHYGQFSNRLACGSITAVNIPVGSTPTYVSQSTARCQDGDSGGPVWRVATPRQPRGLVNGGDVDVPPDANGNYPCRYVALDDQLAGTGWNLL